MLERRGLSHIEFVITFVIFVAFIVFAFVFFSPLQSGRAIKSSLDYISLEIEDFAEREMETYSVSILPGASGDVAIDIPGISNRINASVENSSGEVIPSFRDSTGAVNFAMPRDNFVRVKYSSAFTNGARILGLLIDDSMYSISSSNVDKIYFENLLLELNRSYFFNYAGLKTSFNIPNRIDFGFYVIFNDGFLISSIKDVPDNVEILSTDDRVAIVRSSGEEEYATMRIMVW